MTAPRVWRSGRAVRGAARRAASAAAYALADARLSGRRQWRPTRVRATCAARRRIVRRALPRERAAASPPASPRSVSAAHHPLFVVALPPRACEQKSNPFLPPQVVRVQPRWWIAPPLSAQRGSHAFPSLSPGADTALRLHIASTTVIP